MKLTQRELTIAAQIVSKLRVGLDSTPYTEIFDQAHREFCIQMGKEFDPNHTWLALVGARKRGLCSRRFRDKSHNMN
ncbi:MAG: hypothetical protein JKX85_07975 [Phycisphaeraceae bacterium]|nr:hypothetical protein [Phycisphaeraceae bacterium]